MIATIGLLGLLQAVVAKRYGVANQPVDSYLPARRVRRGAASRSRRSGSTSSASRWSSRSGSGRGRATPASASPSTPAPRTSGRCRRSAGRPTGSPPSPGRSAACSAGSPPCSPRRSPGCRRSTFTIVVTVAGLGAALLGGFHSFPLTLLGGLIIGVGEAMATLYGGDITDFFHQDLITGPQPHARVPRDLPRGRRPRPRPAAAVARRRAAAEARHRRDQRPRRARSRRRSSLALLFGVMDDVVGAGHLHLAGQRAS